MNFLTVPDAAFKPKITNSHQKLIKVRRKLRAVPASDTSPYKVIKVARKAVKPKLSEVPLPGTIEEDYLLECQGNPINFLRFKNPSTGKFELNKRVFHPEYTEDGDLVPTSIIGSQEKILKQKKDTKITTNNDQSPKPIKSMSTRSMILKKEAQITPDQKYYEKIKQINEGIKKEAEKSEKMLSMLKTGPRITESQQKNCLENYCKTNDYWHQLSNTLSNKTKRPKEDLLLNCAPFYRQKKEETDLLDRLAPLRDKFGNLT